MTAGAMALYVLIAIKASFLDLMQPLYGMLCDPSRQWIVINPDADRHNVDHLTYLRSTERG